MLTRNNVIWVLGMIAGGLSFIVGHFGLFHLPPAWQGPLELIAIFVGGGSAALRQSPLPHSDSRDQTVELSRLVVNKPNVPAPSTPGTFGRP